jgi:hypothetical protein
VEFRMALLALCAQNLLHDPLASLTSFNVGIGDGRWKSGIGNGFADPKVLNLNILILKAVVPVRVRLRVGASPAKG